MHGDRAFPLAIHVTHGGKIIALNQDEATFGGNAKVSASGEASGQQTYHDHGPNQPLDVKAVTVEAVICSDDRRSTELHGLASVDGEGEYQYRINLVDGGEPGTEDRYWIFIPGVAYDSGDQELEGGNVQIRGTTG